MTEELEEAAEDIIENCLEELEGLATSVEDLRDVLEMGVRKFLARKEDLD